MTAKKQRSLFITFEGIDGSGKSTQAVMVYRLLSGMGYRVKLLREPGSTAVAERIRSILLDKRLNITDLGELLLYEASRAELTSREIVPLLQGGTIVLCDRFYDSTTAYQGYGRNLDIKMVRSLNRIAVDRQVPDMTFLLDLDIKTALSRLGDQKDRLELQSKRFFQRVRTGFLEIARKERRRVKVVDATRSVDTVFEDIKKVLVKKLKT